jgi:rod shape-determining protein MreD
MVRAGLVSKRRIGDGPVTGAAYVPAASVIAASFLSSLPILSQNGWYPDFAFLVLIGWRLLRSDPFPAWWAAPLGFINDLLAGTPIGFSVSLWTAAMLLLDLADRRTHFRDYWMEWGFAALLLIGHEFAQLRVAAWTGSPLPLATLVPPVLISIAAFPMIAWIIGRIDYWRLGRV